MPLILALGRQKQVDFYESEARLVYRESSRPARATHRKIVSNKETNKETNKPIVVVQTW